MNNCSSNSYSARARRCQKQPVYTSDKRAKFTQRENKKWIRLLTVVGYIIFVSLPALSLSFYYVYLWDPGYMSKNDSVGNLQYPAKYIEPIKSDRPHREIPTPDPQQPEKQQMEPELDRILREGAKSMEASHESRRPR